MEGRINAARGDGEPLYDNTRQSMEQAFGSDFGGVRIHKDSAADSLNQSLQARAFTTGQDIFFKNGEYNPASQAGKQLLAHELTHTIQQTGKRELKPTSNQPASPTNVQTAPRTPLKQPPPVPSKAGRPPLPGKSSPGEIYGSKPLEGMDPLTYDEAIVKFKQWKKPRLLGGLSKAKRKTEAEKYLAEVVKNSKKYTHHTPMIVNSILEAYKNTFGEELSKIDEMKQLQQVGSGYTEERGGRHLEEFGKEAERERKEELIGGIEGSIGAGFTMGEEGSETTRDLIDELVPKDSEGKSFSESKKGGPPMDIAEGATDIFSGLGLGISSIFGFVKAAKISWKKHGFKKFNTIIDAIGSGLGAVVKGARGVVGVVKGAVKGAVKAGKSNPLAVAKEVLGPIPDAVKTIVGIVKIAVAAAKKKSKESLEAAWETVKSGVGTISGTVSAVFNSFQIFGDAVPIIGAIAKGISAILNGIEAGYMFVKKVLKYLSMKKMTDRILAKIKELLAVPAKTEAERADKQGKKDRLVYIGKNNLKKMKNVGREIAKQGLALVGNGVKLIGAVSSLVGEILSLTVAAAPAGAVLKVFGIFSNVLGSIISGIGAAIAFVPKLFHSIRQAGRNVAAKEGKTGKFFRALGFSTEKSSEKKHEERKMVVAGIFTDAAKLKTDFDDPAGKDREKVKAELPKYKDLEFEIEATGANKEELYKLNEEADDEERSKKQVKIIYDALKER